jgi:hypothetical protein
MTNPEDDSPEYHRRIQTGLDHLRAIATTHMDVVQKSGWMARAESPAMSDISLSADFTESPGWSDPITDIGTFIGLNLLASSEISLSFVERLEDDAACAFTHLILSRTSLEASANAYWLAEPGLTYTDRIKRGLWYRLHSVREELRATPEQRPLHLKRMKALGAVATHYGWVANSTNNDAVFRDGFHRPSMKSQLNAILTGEGDHTIGQALWSYLSAVTHLTWYGIRETIIPPYPTNIGTIEVTVVGVGSDSRFVNTLTTCLTKMFAAAATAHLQYMGWESDDDWIAVRDAALRWANDGNRARDG